MTATKVKAARSARKTTTRSKDKPKRQNAQKKAEKLPKNLGSFSIDDTTPLHVAIESASRNDRSFVKTANVINPTKVVKSSRTKINRTARAAAVSPPTSPQSSSSRRVCKVKEDKISHPCSFLLEDEEKRLTFIFGRLKLFDTGPLKKLTEGLIDALFPKRRGRMPYKGTQRFCGMPEWWPSTNVFEYNGPHHKEKPELTCLLVFLARLHWTREDYVKHNQGGEATTRLDDGWSAFFEDKFCWGTIKGLDIYARKTDKMLLHERYLKEVILVLRAEYEFFQGRLAGSHMFSFVDVYPSPLPPKVVEFPGLYFRQRKFSDEEMAKTLVSDDQSSSDVTKAVDNVMTEGSVTATSVDTWPSTMPHSSAGSPWSSGCSDDNYKIENESPRSIADHVASYDPMEHQTDVVPTSMDLKLEELSLGSAWPQYNYNSHVADTSSGYTNLPGTYAGVNADWLTSQSAAPEQMDGPRMASPFTTTAGTFYSPTYHCPSGYGCSISAATYEPAIYDDSVDATGFPNYRSYGQAGAYANGDMTGAYPGICPSSQDGAKSNVHPYQIFGRYIGKYPDREPCQQQRLCAACAAWSGPGASYCTRLFTGHSAGVDGGAHT